MGQRILRIASLPFLFLTVCSLASDVPIEQQLAHHKGELLMEMGKPRQAERAFMDYLEDYPIPLSLRASAWYEIAHCRMDRGKRLKAVEAFGECVSEAQDSEWAQKGLVELMQMCQAEMHRLQAGELDGWLHTGGRERILDFLEKALQLVPFEQGGDEMQLFVAQTRAKQRDWPEANAAIEQLLKSYPYSELRDDAFFGWCEVEYLQCRSSEYDITQIDVALERINNFLSIYPESPFVPGVQDMRTDLVDRKAKKAFSIGTFYMKRKKPEAALIAFHRVVEQYPQTSWQEQASQKIEELTSQQEEVVNER